jgi:hypothetical protein
MLDLGSQGQSEKLWDYADLRFTDMDGNILDWVPDRHDPQIAWVTLPDDSKFPLYIRMRWNEAVVINLDGCRDRMAVGRWIQITSGEVNEEFWHSCHEVVWRKKNDSCK